MPVYRSFLFAPGNHARRVEKSLSLSTDAVILDLEDAVAQNEKEATRALVVQALSLPRRCQAYVRVNALSTTWSYGDIEAVVVAGLDGIVLPKAESAAELQTAEWMISALERARGLKPGAIDLMPIIETAKGYVALESILRSGTRVRRVAFGAGDFTLDAGIEARIGDEIAHIRIVAAEREQRFKLRPDAISGAGFRRALVIGKVEKRLGIARGNAHSAGRRRRGLIKGLVCGSHGFSRSCFLREK